MNCFKNTILVLISICFLGAPAFAAEQSKTLLFGKIESNLWEATASVFLHLADDDQQADRTSLADYRDDVETIDRMVAKLEKMPVREVLERLVAAGLDSIPGGGAEILEDGVRRQIWSRAKASTEQWLGVHREAHELGLRTTATMMFGVGEPVSARITHLLGVRNLQDDTGGFTAFIPWTFQDSSTDLEGEVEPSGGHDYLRTLAISRLALDNVDHVQGSWVTQGPKVGQVSLFFGADDLGSIMLEENVVAAAGAQYRMTQSEMERVIQEAGYSPRQRRTLYEPL